MNARTRSSVGAGRGGGNAKSVINKKNEINETKEQIRKRESKKSGWNSIRDVEKKLVELENQYNRARTERSRKQIRKLQDVYEKQAKALNIKEFETNQENMKKNKLGSDIFTIEENSDTNSDKD